MTLHRKTIGRGSDVDLSIADEYVSTRHAVLIWDDVARTMTVEDIGSANGTYVNGHVIGYCPRHLSVGDVVRVGRTEIPWTRPL
jgi:pSer/pThr/pTyr-binding forkhead associated (FHA) protein